ncbi:Thioesterase domain [Madurella fahalii]|uniref:Thioesterase domain n=1 Tax=Madurella fahalii TaxID=1157608 RepID=A0ABQ0GJC1_9PEZI
MNQTQDQPVWECLQDVLRLQAELSSGRYLIFYSLGSIASTPKRVSYNALYHESKKLSVRLSSLASFAEGRPVILHLDDHWDAVLWFWAVLLANGIPVLSSPLSNVGEHREKHLQGLSQLLESPICIVRAASLHLFEGGDHTLELYTVESLLSPKAVALRRSRKPKGRGINTSAVLMLTSGSTGNAKAVCLSHKQLMASVSGKTSVRPPSPDASFFNWIGLDHVAGLVEIHLQALWLGADQVHAHAADLVASPLLFLELLSRHKISRTFAPNFFLAKLVAAYDEDHGAKPSAPRRWDLSHLAAVVSGGEANPVPTCTAAAALLERYGATKSVIMPGFGMTETCAGAIYNVNCPELDIAHGRVVASLGRCMPGIEMRIMSDASDQPVAPGESGRLEVRGAVVFDGYYRNPAATSEAFTADGWFRTGDQANLDDEGNLCLTGRAKDVININGVKIVTADVQAALDAALRDTCATRVVCFPSRAARAATEQITVAYLPRTWPPKGEDMAAVDRLTRQSCMMVSSANRPVIFAVSEESLSLLPVTTLGKISGSKMTRLFEAGVFDKDVTYHGEAVSRFMLGQSTTSEAELSGFEAVLRADFAEIMGFPDPVMVGVETPVFELGFTSMDVIRLKHRVDTQLGISVPAVVFLKEHNVRLLAAALNNIVNRSLPTGPVLEAFEYEPVVTLRSSGTKPPLWLVHPGIGEILGFVALAQHLSSDDRPVHAFRPRGFESNQLPFTSISEAVDTYVSAIKNRQPHGPYVLAGYSYGGMLAFEMAKKLEAIAGLGEEGVKFLGSFNLPPHIKSRMRQLGWNICLLNLSQFLGLITVNQCIEMEAAPPDRYRGLPREDAFVAVLALADNERVRELGLSEEALVRWVDVAYGLQSMAVDYEPSGMVASIDIFHAEPPKVVAGSREEWVKKNLSRWSEFCHEVPRFHDVGGTHYTMLGPDHVETFAEILREALVARGV